MADAALIARKLANLRRIEAEVRGGASGAASAPEPPPARTRSPELALRLAEALDGEVLATPFGRVVRVENVARPVAIDREALARLPGQPPPDVPLVCLDTETTGLATAAGTLAFLVGLGWWEGQRFRQVQLVVPDHPDEAAMLEVLASQIPGHCWLVTYNGRTFDWPLLVARFRMARRDAPPHAGHLDLLTTVRRLFRHRMIDARLRTAEGALLGMGRFEDIDGAEIPTRYITFLRGGNPAGLLPVLEHNEQDVRSLARLLAHLADHLGDESRRHLAPDGDLLGLSRSMRREGRLDDAMACLDLALSRPSPVIAPRSDRAIDPYGNASIASAIAELSLARTSRVMRDQVVRERARLLRQIGRLDDARQAWRDLAARNGPLSAIACVELAKVLEHIDRDLDAALDAVALAERLVARAAALNNPLPLLEADLARRRARLERRRWGGALRAARPAREGVAHPVPHGRPRRDGVEAQALNGR